MFNISENLKLAGFIRFMY